MDFIEKYPTLNWYWENISCNPNITPEFTKKYLTKFTNWFLIFRSRNVYLELLEENLDKPLLWNKPLWWDDISCNTNLTFEFVNKHIDKPWVWRKISSNPNITYHAITKFSPKPLINKIILDNIKQYTLEILKKKEQLLRFRKMILS